MTLQLTTIQQRRQDRKSRPKPVQFDMFAQPEETPAPVVQSPRAAAIAEETAMRTEAVRVLAVKAGKPAAKASKVKPKVLTP